MNQTDTIYKLLRMSELATFVTSGTFGGSPDDLRDGFIHLSKEDQMAGTLAKHFSGESNIFALDCLPLLQVPELKWEQSRGGALFPHLYRPMRMSDVRVIWPLPEKKWPPDDIG